MTRISLIELVMFKQTLEELKGNHTGSRQRHSQCKGPEVSTCAACLRRSDKANGWNKMSWQVSTRRCNATEAELDELGVVTRS